MLVASGSSTSLADDLLAAAHWQAEFGRCERVNKFQRQSRHIGRSTEWHICLAVIGVVAAPARLKTPCRRMRHIGLANWWHIGLEVVVVARSCYSRSVLSRRQRSASSAARCSCPSRSAPCCHWNHHSSSAASGAARCAST